MQDACEFLEYLLDPIFSENLNGLCRFQKVEIYECQWCFKVSKVENPLDMGTRLILGNLNNETSLSGLIKLNFEKLEVYKDCDCGGIRLDHEGGILHYYPSGFTAEPDSALYIGFACLITRLE